MIGSLVLTLASFGAQSEPASATVALETEDFHTAWKVICAEPDELARWRGRAEILYRAGDPAGAFAAARGGLVIDPCQIDLVYYAAGAAIWLENVPAALHYTERLLQIAAAKEQEKPGNWRAWVDAANVLSGECRLLEERESELSRTLVRLKRTSIGGLALWLLVFGLLLWSRQIEQARLINRLEQGG